MNAVTLRKRRDAEQSFTITCPYHAWSYGFDGDLKAARNTEKMVDFDYAGWFLWPNLTIWIYPGEPSCPSTRYIISAKCTSTPWTAISEVASKSPGQLNQPKF